MENKLLNEKKQGVKLSIIDIFDLEDYIKICNAIQSLGYVGVVVDNGNTAFFKKNESVAK